MPAVSVLIALALIACSSEGGPGGQSGAGGPSSPSGTSGTHGDSGKGGHAAGAGHGGDTGSGAAGAGGGSGTGGGGGGGAQTTLFVDPRVPDCGGAGANSRVVGTVAGHSVDFRPGIASYIAGGRFEYVRVEPGNTIGYPLEFEFVPGALVPGRASRLIGHALWVPEDQPGGGRWYCITSGEFGPVPESEQPPGDDDAAFKFRIDGAHAEIDCSGGPVDIDLVGCIYRTDPTIPASARDRVSSEDSPECTPLTERFAGHYLDDSVVQCDEAELPGLPNPTHYGRRQALALRTPLEPGRTYAMNQWFGEASAQAATVTELWGQSEPCGPVDELLWTSELGTAHRYCLEFVPTLPHTHLLRVMRHLDLNGIDTLGDLRICAGGSCGGTIDGRGAAPGTVVTTVPGTYAFDGPGQLDGSTAWRLGLAGQIAMLDGSGGSFDARELVALAFRMGPHEPFSDRWYCASAGTRTEGDRTNSYYVDFSGITRMPECSALSGGETLTITWDHAAQRAATASSLPALVGTDLYLSGRCFASQCDLTIRHTMMETWHLFARVDGDLGSAARPNVDVTVPITDAAWLVAPEAGPIAVTCGLGGTITRDVAAMTTTIELTGLAAPTPCGGEAATPSTARFVLR